MLVAIACQGASGADDVVDPRIQTASVFDGVHLQWFKDQEQAWKDDPNRAVVQGPYIITGTGQVAQASVRLPVAPDDRSTGIKGIIRVEPVPSEDGSGTPGDPWTRLGSIVVLDDMGQPVELIRFVTGFGGTSTYEADLTAFAPLLSGERTFRATLSSFSQPGWKLWFELVYYPDTAGARRPHMVQALFMEPEIEAGSGLIRKRVRIPRGLSRPRIRLLSTGHGSQKGDEFISRTHVLRVDGQEVLRFRPWSEHGAGVRGLNPWSGRLIIDGREIWASDFDRSGWAPGLMVQPLVAPMPELGPGTHVIELEILGLQAPPPGAPGNFWSVSACILADQPWPAPRGSDLQDALESP